MSNRALTILALMALFSVQLRDCSSLTSVDHQSMQCCGSGSCNPAHHSHDCCKTMVVPSASIGVPSQQPVLAAPVAFVVDRISLFQLPVVPETFHPEFNPQQHSPPELYTLHSSLLI